MSNNSPSVQHLVAIQADIFRLAKRDHALSPARLAALSGIPKTTIESWSSGAAMPAHALVRLSQYLPDELTSLLFEPFDKAVTTTSPVDGDLAALGCETAGFTTDYVEAVADGKVTPIERARLIERAARVAAKAHRVRVA